MKVITFEEYKSFPKDGFVFFYSIPGFCGLCTQYETEISKYDIPSLIKVSASASEENALMEHKILALPCTRFYKGETVVYEKYGVLYERQVQELMQEIEKWKN